MDLAFIKNFFSCYGLPTVIISVITSVCCYGLVAIFKDKYVVFIKTQLPFLLSIIFHTVYDMIFISKAFVFNEEVIASGILSGSVAIIINSLINKLKRGDMVALSATALLIEGLLEGIVPKSCISMTAVAVENIINDQTADRKKEELIEEITKIVKSYSEDGFTDYEIEKTAELIVQAVSAI